MSYLFHRIEKLCAMSTFTQALPACLLAAIVSCSQGPQLPQHIQAAGGIEPLKTECADLVSKFQNTRLDSISAANYPPVIVKLKPQIVEIEEQRSFPFVHIQITGGFNHHGLLISGKPLPLDFVPVRGGGGKWRVWKLANGVFEYRE